MKFHNSRMIISTLLVLAALCLAACAKNEKGGYDINIGTIAESFRTGKLVVNEDESDTFARPAKPRDGCILLAGKLESDDQYDCTNPSRPTYDGNADDIRGLGFEDDCWFSAEVNKDTGEVVSAKMYFFGHARRALYLEGKLDQKLNGSFGKISPDGYVISFYGPVFEEWDMQKNGKYSNQGAVITGKGNILSAAAGATFKGKLYVDVDAVPVKAPSKKNCDANVTFGTATFRVIR